jgi:hypothetical protein
VKLLQDPKLIASFANREDHCILQIFAVYQIFMQAVKLIASHWTLMRQLQLNAGRKLIAAYCIP